MEIFRKNNIWLRHRTKKKIKKNHEDLFNLPHINLINNFHNFISDRKSWFWVFIFVIVCFIFPIFIDIDELEILTINELTVKTIVDQRTTNLATIISISLVVVGFLINNLAVKSPITYKLLFKKSLLYLIIYLTLSTIFCFIIASTLRDSIPHFHYTRLVLGGTYLCLLILIIIGHMFRKIIHFTNEKEISKMLKYELLNEGRIKIKRILILNYSSHIYKNFMIRYGTVTFNFVFSIEDLLNSKITVGEVKGEKTRCLIDVNLLLIKLFILFKKNKLKKMYFKDLVLDNSINYADDILWLESNNNTKFEKWFLKKCLKTIKIKATIKDENVYRNEFDQKIIQLAEENKYRSLSDPLEAYLELYNLQMINQK